MAQASSPRQFCPTSAANTPNDDDKRRRIGAELSRGPGPEPLDSTALPRPSALAASADHDQPRLWPPPVAASTSSSSAPPYIPAPILVADPDVSAIAQPAGLAALLSSTSSWRAAGSHRPHRAFSLSAAGPAPQPNRYAQPDFGYRASSAISPAAPPLASPADPRTYAAAAESPAASPSTYQQQQQQQPLSASPAPLPPPKLPPLSSLSPNPAAKDNVEDAPGLLLPYQATALGASSSGHRPRELSADYSQSHSPILPSLLSSSSTTTTSTTISTPGTSSAPITPSLSSPSAPLQPPSTMANHGHNPHGQPRLPSTSSFAYATGPPSPYPPSTLSQAPPYSYSSAGVGPPGGGSTLGSSASTGSGMSELYRQPPSVGPAPMSQPLPSMRTIDPLQLPPPPPSAPGMHLGPPPPPPPPSQQQSLPPSGMGYYSMPPPYGLPPPQYGLPGPLGHFPDIRMPSMSMSTIPRHKKEIKRRTKTGCMTCRKRRIKCDETHPTCNNCKKSKRECAGYDPIFKPQTQSPGVLQNPSSAPGSFSASVANAGDMNTNRTASIPITPTAAAAVAAAAAAAASTASTLAAIKSPSSVTAPPPLPTASRPPMTGMYTTTHSSEPASNAPYNAASAYQPSSYSQRSILAPLDDHLAPSDQSGQVYKSKMKVDEMIKLSGPAPPPLTETPSRDMLDDLVKYYYDVYVPGLTTFFETTWYKFKASGTTNPISILLSNRTLIGLLATYAGSSFTRPQQIGGLLATQPPVSPSLEMNLVWSLACMAYATPATVNLPRPEPLEADNAAEARNRLVAVDALLSGGCLRTNPCLPPPDSGDRHNIREYQFWWWLAEYLRLQHDAGWSGTPGNSMTRLREQALMEMARLQDGRENREIIYAIAVLRDLAPRFPPGYLGTDDIAQQHGQYPSEDNPRVQLSVATSCIYKTASEYSNTFSVARRMAQLGIKAFIDPGYSIRRL